MHGGESYLGAERDAFPDVVGGHDQKGEALADLSEASKGRYIFYGEV